MFWNTAAITSALVLSTPTCVLACQCADVLEARTGSGPVDLTALREKKAQNIIRGNVVEFVAGPYSKVIKSTGAELSLNGTNIASMTTAGGDFPMALTTISINETVKGQAKGIIRVLTGMGTGDCGVPELFFGALAYQADIEFEVTPVEGASNLYSVDMCSYVKDMSSDGEEKSPEPLPPIE
ncbi:MAG: hypothetical protein R3D32_10345 [Nitratireductor sp.]